MLVLPVSYLSGDRQLHAFLDVITGYLGQLSLDVDIMPVGVVGHFCSILQFVASFRRGKAELGDAPAVVELMELGILAYVPDSACLRPHGGNGCAR